MFTLDSLHLHLVLLPPSIQVGHSQISLNEMASPVLCFLALKPDSLSVVSPCSSHIGVDPAYFFPPTLPFFLPLSFSLLVLCSRLSSFQIQNCHFSHRVHAVLFTLHTLLPPSQILNTVASHVVFLSAQHAFLPCLSPLFFFLYPSVVSTLILALLSNNSVYPLLLWGSLTLGVSSADFLCLAWAKPPFLAPAPTSFVHVHTQLASSYPLVPTCCFLFFTSCLSLLLYNLNSYFPLSFSFPFLLCCCSWVGQFTLSCSLHSFKLSILHFLFLPFSHSFSEKNYTSSGAW